MKRALIVLASVLTVAAPAMADEALAKAKGCLGCHKIDGKMVGPAYKEVAAKHKNDASKADALSEKIMKGGSGVYGPIPMQAQPQVSKDEAVKLAKWILTLK